MERGPNWRKDTIEHLNNDLSKLRVDSGQNSNWKQQSNPGRVIASDCSANDTYLVDHGQYPGSKSLTFEEVQMEASARFLRNLKGL